MTALAAQERLSVNINIEHANMSGLARKLGFYTNSAMLARGLRDLEQLLADEAEGKELFAQEEGKISQIHSADFKDNPNNMGVGKILHSLLADAQSSERISALMDKMSMDNPSEVVRAAYRFLDRTSDPNASFFVKNRDGHAISVSFRDAPPARTGVTEKLKAAFRNWLPMARP